MKAKKKSYKRPSNNPVYMPALRILKRDIRRKYGEMMINVMNSFDSTLILRFFSDFCTPNFQTILNYSSDTLQILHQTPTIIGIEEQVKNFSMNYKLMPDVVFTITNVKVCKRSNSSGSRVVANTSMRGTLLYSVSKRKGITENGDMTAISTVHEDLNDAVILEPLENPLDYLMNGIITLNLDEQHRITLIEIQPSDGHHLFPQVPMELT